LNELAARPATSHRTVAAVLAAGLLLRAIWALVIPVVPISDSHAYYVFARMLATCGTYGWQCDQPSAYWPPGTSLLYAALFKAFGPGFGPIVILNMALFAGTTWLTMILAGEWFGPRVAAIAGWLLALWPSQVQFTTVLASELPFSLGLMGGLFLWTRASWPPWRAGLAAGLAFGATALIRPTALLIPALLAVAEVARSRRLRPTLVKAAIVYAALFAILAPWAARNTHVFGRHVLVSTNGGANLWMGNHEAAGGGYTDLPPEALAIQNEADRDEYLGQTAKRFIRAHPLRFLQLVVRRLIITHGGESIGVVWNETGVTERFGARAMMPLKLANGAYWVLALLAAIGGIVVLVRSMGLRAVVLTPVALLWAYFAAIHAIVVAQDRYHFPSIPFIAALAAVAADRWWTVRGAIKAAARPAPAPSEGRLGAS
jgi:hypothetical protein